MMRFPNVRKWLTVHQSNFLGAFVAGLTMFSATAVFAASKPVSGAELRMEQDASAEAEQMSEALREMRAQILQISNISQRESILSELKSYEEGLQTVRARVQVDEMEANAQLRSELARVTQFMKRRYAELGIKPDPNSVIYKFYVRWMAANEQLGRSLGANQVDAEAVAKELLGGKYDKLTSEQKDALKSKLSVLAQLIDKNEAGVKDQFLSVLEDLKSKFGIEPGASGLREAIESHSSLIARDGRDAMDPLMSGKFSLSSSERVALSGLKSSGSTKSWADRGLSGLGLFPDRPLQFTADPRTASQVLASNGPALINEDELLPYRDLLASAEKFNEAAADLAVNPDGNIKHLGMPDASRAPASTSTPLNWSNKAPAGSGTQQALAPTPAQNANPPREISSHSAGPTKTTPSQPAGSNKAPTDAAENMESASGDGAMCAEGSLACEAPTQTTQSQHQSAIPLASNKNTFSKPVQLDKTPQKVVTMVDSDGSYRFVKPDQSNAGFADGAKSIPSDATLPTQIAPTVKDKITELIDSDHEESLTNLSCSISDIKFSGSKKSVETDPKKNGVQFALDVLSFNSKGKYLCKKSLKEVAENGCYEEKKTTSAYDQACHSCLQYLLLHEGIVATSGKGGATEPFYTPKDNWLYKIVSRNIKLKCLKSEKSFVNVVYKAREQYAAAEKLAPVPAQAFSTPSKKSFAVAVMAHESLSKMPDDIGEARPAEAGTHNSAGSAKVEADVSSMSPDFCADEFRAQLDGNKTSSEMQKYAAFFNGLVRPSSGKDAQRKVERKVRRLLAQIMFAKDPRCVNTSMHRFNGDLANIPGGMLNARQCVKVDPASSDEVDKLRIAALNWWISSLYVESSKEGKVLSSYDVQRVYAQSVAFHDANRRVRSAEKMGTILTVDEIDRGAEWMGGVAWQIEKCPGWRELVIQSEKELRAAAAKCGSIEAAHLMKNPTKAGMDQLITVFKKGEKPKQEDFGIDVKLSSTLELPKNPYDQGRKPASLPQIVLDSADAFRGSSTPECLEIRKRYGFYLSSIVMPSTGPSASGVQTELHNAWEAANVGIVNEDGKGAHKSN